MPGAANMRKASCRCARIAKLKQRKRQLAAINDTQCRTLSGLSMREALEKAQSS